MRTPPPEDFPPAKDLAASPQQNTMSDSLPGAAAQQIAQTLPGPDPAALARTLDSGPGLSDAADAVTATVTVSASAFPVINWSRYEFLQLLGRGGMGAVYKGRDRRLGRIVALKFIHGEDPGQIQRFTQEARTQARLEHPNICKIPARCQNSDGAPRL